MVVALQELHGCCCSACPGSPGEKWPRTYEIACWRRVGTGGTLRMGAGGFRPSSTAVYIARQDRGFGDAGRGNPQIQQRFLRHRNKISLLPKAMIVQSLRGSANLAVDLRQGGAGVNDRKNHYVPGGCKCGSTFQNMRTGMVQERFGQLIENPPVEAGRLCAPRSGYRALRKASLVDNCNPPTVKH